MGISKLCCHNSESGLNSRTPFFQRFACGVGHVMNDITRQLLFSFRLVIFMQVFGLSAANAGWLMLYGLISVAVSSAICSFLIDNFKIPYLSKTLGKRKAWHLIGTVLGAIVIPFYFSSCFLCQSDQGQWQLMIYIPVLNTMLSFSFGLMEISHLSIIPAIAKDQSEAVELNAWRYIGIFFSILGFLLHWVDFKSSCMFENVPGELRRHVSRNSMILFVFLKDCFFLLEWHCDLHRCMVDNRTR